MSSRRFIKRATALVILPLLVILGTSRAQAYFLCAFDSVAREACCCPKMHEPSEAKHTASDASCVKAACCCSIEERGAVATPHASVQDKDVASGAVIIPMGFAVDLPAPTVAPGVARIPHVPGQHPPPRRTASLFSQHVSLLV